MLAIAMVLGRFIRKCYPQIRRKNHLKERIYFSPTERWFDINSFPLHGDFFCVVMSNVTDQVKSELLKTEQLSLLEKSREQLVSSLCHIVEMKDPYTYGHQERTTIIACKIANHLGFDKKRVQTVKFAALTHDVGKIAIPAEYLVKPSKLSETEFACIRDHAEHGFNVLKKVEFDGPVAEIVKQHHERIDGSGYPMGLKQDQILLEAKIIGVADVVEAMSSHRPYRPKIGIEAAMKEIISNTNIKYDSAVVAAALTLYNAGEFDFLL